MQGKHNCTMYEQHFLKGGLSRVWKEKTNADMHLHVERGTIRFQSLEIRFEGVAVGIRVALRLDQRAVPCSLFLVPLGMNFSDLGHEFFVGNDRQW